MTPPPLIHKRGCSTVSPGGTCIMSDAVDLTLSERKLRVGQPWPPGHVQSCLHGTDAAIELVAASPSGCCWAETWLCIWFGDSMYGKLVCGLVLYRLLIQRTEVKGY